MRVYILVYHIPGDKVNSQFSFLFFPPAFFEIGARPAAAFCADHVQKNALFAILFFMGYKKQLVRFNVNKIALLSVFLFLIPCAIALLINLLWFKRPFLLTPAFYWDLLIVVGIYIVGLLAHEGIHALCALLFAKVAPSDLSFGAHLRQLMLYCHVKTPLTVAQYRLMLLPPMILTGVVPLVVSAFLGNFFLVVVFSLLVSGGAGDLVMFFSLRKYKKDQRILDHPEAPAYYLVYDENSLPEDFCEVTPEQEEELKDMMNDKKNGSTGGKSNLLKILAVLLFAALTVLGVFAVAVILKYF